MCCFSPVAAPASFFGRLFRPRATSVHVSDTSIYARMEADGTQALVYSLTLSVRGAVAMILPLPVAAGHGEAAVRFVNLERYPSFFEDLNAGFERYAVTGQMIGAPLRGGPRQKLVVHTVGAFVASYVPSRGDFDRLDARFRLPDEVWSHMRDYADWGFAVFQLEAGQAKRIHPMALRFPTRDAARLFFPTVHVHDGRVHPKAAFDHALYYQHPALGTFGQETPAGWNGDLVTPARAGEFMRLADSLALFDMDAPVARRHLRGQLPNRDTWIDLALAPTEGQESTPMTWGQSKWARPRR